MSDGPSQHANITVLYDQYLIYGIVSWIEANQYKPHVIVDTGYPGVKLPPHCMAKRTETINMSMAAMGNVTWGDTEVSFNARFGGREFRLTIPYQAMVLFNFGGTDSLVQLPWGAARRSEMAGRGNVQPAVMQPVEDDVPVSSEVSEPASPPVDPESTNASNVRHVAFGQPRPPKN
jgi:stringent starvation protein B